MHVEAVVAIRDAGDAHLHGHAAICLG
jgi:hypothetical protein